MRKIGLYLTAIGMTVATMSCSNSSDTAQERNTEESDGYLESTERADSMSIEQREAVDSAYMQSQDNNGQPVTDEEGGSVTETKGTFESGYGTGNNTELHPSPTGSDGTATGRGSEDSAEE